jgi:hypothetical protein
VPAMRLRFIPRIDVDLEATTALLPLHRIGRLPSTERAVCTNRPIRQDALDEFVWKEIIRLLDDPMLVQGEIDRRQQVAQNADPLRKREEALRREQTRWENAAIGSSALIRKDW